MTLPWSSGALEGDPAGALAVFQKSLTVQLMATTRADFSMCRPDEPVSQVAERNRADSFDFIPVLDTRAAAGETVVGVLDLAARAGDAPSSQTVRAVMQPLGEEDLIGADASIFDFISDADRHRFRFVVSGREISGLVTLSDLQRLPVRAALFGMVTQLEMTMAEVIRYRFADNDSWRSHLTEERRTKLDAELQSARLADTLVDSLQYTQFGDKVTIIKKAWPFATGAGPSKSRFERDMRDLQSLRDNLAHANDYAATSETASHVCGLVRAALEWIDRLAVCCRQFQDAPEIPSDRA